MCGEDCGGLSKGALGHQQLSVSQSGDRKCNSSIRMSKNKKMKKPEKSWKIPELKDLSAFSYEKLTFLLKEKTSS